MLMVPASVQAVSWLACWFLQINSKEAGWVWPLWGESRISIGFPPSLFLHTSFWLSPYISGVETYVSLLISAQWLLFWDHWSYQSCFNYVELFTWAKCMRVTIWTPYEFSGKNWAWDSGQGSRTRGSLMGLPVNHNCRVSAVFFNLPN